ncbi:serine/threonine-protein kinase [Pendulispora brunnea]|uniref:non-specific serine/threonine protein kinase n=2 Tax=Pendulispora brunnea TaxID=2905690 RepID=A0ABZ2K481_9BACT
MGIVYEAVDPELHRVVALKVLRADLRAAQKRLLAEAEAMAKLAHPNVVTIYEFGCSGECAFIAMECVQGSSLRHWVGAESRSGDAVLDVFLQAAEGLRAAHEAGLVHRDFKPENVFVSTSGRVMVGDFGLAVSALSETKAVAGSPAYMAPEQRAGKRLDARSDQYSFCVALGEMLHEAAGAIPRWLSPILARGTDPHAESRFPSMAALIVAIRSGLTRSKGRPRRIAWVLGGIAALGLMAFAFRLGKHEKTPTPALCERSDAVVAATWSPEVQSRIEQTFRATNSALWEGAWRKTQDALTRYADSYRDVTHRMCESATSEAPALVERKMTCASEGLETFRALAGKLEHADAPMLEQVPAMLRLLPPVSACDEAVDASDMVPPPPKDKAASVDVAKAKIAQASTTLTAGRYEEALSSSEDAWKAANAAGYLPVIAEAYLALGTAHGLLGHVDESAQALEQAASSASAGRAPRVAIRAWIALVQFVGYEGRRYDDGYRYAQYAKAALESIPSAFELDAERLTWTRQLLLAQKRQDEAFEVSKEELVLVEFRLGRSHHRYGEALDGLASALAAKGRNRDALEAQEKACAMVEKEFGSPHPEFARCLVHLAGLHGDLGDEARSVEIQQRALVMFAQVPGHPNHLAMSHRNLADSFIMLGRFDEARAELAAARHWGKSASDETRARSLEGWLHLREGKTAEAIADARAVLSRIGSGDAWKRVLPLNVLAEAHLKDGHFSEAAEVADEAAKIANAVYGVSYRSAAPLRMHAEALIALGRAPEAVPLAEAALAAREGSQFDPLDDARAEFTLALALPAAAHERAGDLAHAARAIASSRDPELTARIDGWLATR